MELPRLHLVTNDDVLRSPRFLSDAERVMERGGGAVAIHIRGPGLSGLEIWRIADRLAARAAGWGSHLIVNDRVDVALGCGAAGVQLGRRSMAVAAARLLLGSDPWIGASVHDAAEAKAAAEEGADFVLAGTLYPSASHPSASASGPEWLGEIGHGDVPIIGIGGITPERVPFVRDAGAYGVAVLGGVWHATDPVDALESYLASLESGR